MQNLSPIPEPEITDKIARFPEPVPESNLKAVFTVAELAERWCAHPESVRRLIRDKQIKPLRGFRPFRIPYDEVRRYEAPDSGINKAALLKGARR